MLKKILAAAMFAATVASAPTAFAGDPNDGCLLNSGCYFDSLTNSWVCDDPQIFMDCMSPP